MKAIGLAILGVFFLLLPLGCSKTEQPPPEIVGEVLPAQTEQAPEILVPVVPGRNPFSVAVPSVRQKKSGSVDRAGRDPFLPSSSQPEPVVPEPVVPEPVVPEPVVPEPTPPEPVKPEPTQPEPEEDDPLTEGLLVVLETTDRCWLDVFVDGRRVLRNNVAAGQTLRFEAKREIVLRQVGREHSVRLTVNGKDFGLLGGFVQRLAAGEELGGQVGMRVSLERRHSGGVLVGLRFLAVER